jgi:heme/copper-type cytochrome/quinol oxidase subunit 2
MQFDHSNKLDAVLRGTAITMEIYLIVMLVVALAVTVTYVIAMVRLRKRGQGTQKDRP